MEVTGSVRNPGVVSVVLGQTRINDALDLAGGLIEELVEKEFLEININMSSFVRDGQKIHIPRKDDHVKNSLLISINEASKQELESLPGIGKATAEKIIANRPL